MVNRMRIASMEIRFLPFFNYLLFFWGVNELGLIVRAWLDFVDIPKALLAEGFLALVISKF